jgi:hypothetical protein
VGKAAVWAIQRLWPIVPRAARTVFLVLVSCIGGESVYNPCGIYMAGFFISHSTRIHACLQLLDS